VLGQFSGNRGKAEQEYRKFVQWGIGLKTIWSELRGQALLGEEGFVDTFVDHLKKAYGRSRDPQEPAVRPPSIVGETFQRKILMNLRKRRGTIVKAVEQYGYRQQKIAAHLGIHYSSVSRVEMGER